MTDRFDPAEDLIRLLHAHLKRVLGVAPQTFSFRYKVTEGLGMDWLIVDGPVNHFPQKTSYLLGGLDPVTQALVARCPHLPDPDRDVFFADVFRVSTEEEYCPRGVDQPDGCDFDISVRTEGKLLKATLVVHGNAGTAEHPLHARLTRRFSLPAPTD